MKGSPPNCRPECVLNDDCPQNLACQRMKCMNPCNNICGLNAECKVVNHSPICSCPLNYVGDPFIQCTLKSKFIKLQFNLIIYVIIII
jgi:hypothetical protein